MLNLSGALATLIVILVGGATLTGPDTDWPLLTGITTAAVIDVDRTGRPI